MPATDPAARSDAALLRWSVASVWLATAVLVLHPGYREIGAEYLVRLGLPTWLMWATCAMEAALGVRVGVGPSVRWLSAVQVGMVAAFTAILGALDPMLLASPFGMLSKNLPLVGVILVTERVEREGWSEQARRLLRASMAVVWLTEGIVPKLLFQQEVELSMVGRLGLGFVDASVLVGGLGVVQALSGLAALRLTGSALGWLLAAQLAALVLLPLMVTAIYPELWVHPFGPLTKNAPLIAGTYLLLRQCSSRS